MGKIFNEHRDKSLGNYIYLLDDYYNYILLFIIIDNN